MSARTASADSSRVYNPVVDEESCENGAKEKFPQTRESSATPSSGVPWQMLPAGALPLPGNGVSITESARRIFRAMGSYKQPAYFFRGGAVVELDRAGGVRALSDADFCSRIERCGTVVALQRGSKDKRFWSASKCSRAEAKLLLAALEARELLPPLSLVCDGPLAVPGEDGVLRVLGRGYHRELDGVLVRAGELSTADLPPVDAAAAALANLLVDFDFLTPSDRSRALAALIAPALQLGGHLNEPAPFDVSEANESQSGKGYRAKLVAALYGERLQTIAQSSNGVGGMDEDFRAALAGGRPFLLLDNLRGNLDSPTIEAFATADRFSVRAPYGRPVEVEPRRSVILATSNGLDATRDFANRSSIIRIRKRPADHHFRTWPEGDLLAHLAANRLAYLARVFSVLREWIARGRPRTAGPLAHDRREWAGVLDWIVRELFGAASLLDGHRSAQKRVSNPAANWLRDTALAVERAERLGEGLSATSIAELCEEESVLLPGRRAVTDIATARQSIGRTLGRLFKDVGGETLRADAYTVTRAETCGEERRDAKGFSKGVEMVKIYTFHREGGERP